MQCMQCMQASVHDDVCSKNIRARAYSHACNARTQRAHTHTKVRTSTRTRSGTLIVPVACMVQARDSPDRTNLGMTLSKIENVWLLSDKLERQEWTRKYACPLHRARAHTHTHTLAGVDTQV